MSRESGCSFIHPDPNEAELSDFISSAVIEILFRVLFTISDCNFLNSGGLGIPSFPPQAEATSIRLLTLSG